MNRKKAWCLALAVAFLVAGCGKRRPPMPPVERVQQRTELLSGAQRGNQVTLSWPAPLRNAPDPSVQSIRRIDGTPGHPAVGTPGIEAAYYHQSGDTRAFNDFFYVMPTFTTGEILPAKGKLNALFRFQMAKLGQDDAKNTVTTFEPAVAYLFKDYFAKVQLSYVYAMNKPSEGESVKSQFLQLGFQVQQ